MQCRELVSLATLTTLKVGGVAAYVIECESIADVRAAIAFAEEKQLPYKALGSGSNVLVPDTGYEGVVLHMRIPGVTFREEGDTTLVTVGAGVVWEALVDLVVARGLWGIENLAGIPGTVGAAPVQNIGAYGVEVKDVIDSVEVYDPATDTVSPLSAKDCAFGYRDSLFKRERHLLITAVTFRFMRTGAPQITYPDLERKRAEGVRLDTPSEIAACVRSVRSYKFPDLTTFGTAGSFFKNPILLRQEFTLLQKTYPEIPHFVVEKGIKIPLAWILDSVLSLRGYGTTVVTLFERQPLVLVTHTGATASDVEAFANEIAKKVFDATNIRIEREVQTFV